MGGSFFSFALSLSFLLEERRGRREGGIRGTGEENIILLRTGFRFRFPARLFSTLLFLLLLLLFLLVSSFPTCGFCGGGGGFGVRGRGRVEGFFAFGHIGFSFGAGARVRFCRVLSDFVWYAEEKSLEVFEFKGRYMDGTGSQGSTPHARACVV